MSSNPTWNGWCGGDREALASMATELDVLEYQFSVLGSSVFVDIDGRLIRNQTPKVVLDIMANKLRCALKTITIPKPTVDELARALWRTDRRVLAFIDKVSDSVSDKGDFDNDKYQRAMTVAWERDEGGWRTESIKRAEKMF